MECLPSELITHILRFLSFSDRQEASLVCKNWYSASLHPLLQKNVVVKCKPPEKDALPFGLITQRLTHIDFGDWGTRSISEENLVSLLSKCSSLIVLDLSRCDHLFLSGRLLAGELDRNALKKSLINVRELKLECLRHMTDVTFLRLVSVLPNIQKISLASTQIIFGSTNYNFDPSSPVMLQFSTILKFVYERSKRIKAIDLGYTNIPNNALDTLAKIDGLVLDEISLKSCQEISDKGLVMFVSKQQSLKILNISDCKEIGKSKSFFSYLAKCLPQLHTLKLRKCPKLGECDIESLGDFKSLSNLDLGEAINLHDKDLIKGLCSKGPRLSSLFMPFCPDIHDEFVIQLCNSNYALIHLDLSSCLKLTDSAVHAITRTLTMLQTLRLPYCREISDVGILGYIPENGIVPKFSFDFDHDGCPCTRERESKIFRKPQGLIKEHRSCLAKAHASLEKGEKMFMLSNLERLQVLDLSSCSRLTDLALAEAVKFKELRSLFLNGLPRVVDKTLAVIAHHNPSLEDVNIRASKITDTAVGEIINHCPRLKSLDISQCDGITDTCLKIISQKGKRLRHLDVSFSNLTPQAVADLESRLPNLKVVFKPHLY
ncbi:F-box and leucine-rich repeat protein 13-like [Physella acuta]|uniref:F-box and leucine-rich repeat protein 13-like n=1 Tax=Physella acuta TaxID=109671 RepID=UPI0027DD7E97|nr:F-box and leucine-rich repeat protein 13-like [Physella acuta]